MATGPEMELGFKRPEMHSEKLAGTVKSFQKHIFLTWGLADEWPEDPFDQKHKGTLPVTLDDAISKAKKEIKGKVRITLVERTSDQKEGLVMLYPECLEFDIGSDGAKLPELMAFLKGDVAGAFGRDIEDTTLFVCAHTQRDGRCGFCGPKLTAKALELKREVPKMRIRKCSHVGGHKYAGNVMVYGKDQWHWYGYVTPENLLSVLRGKAQHGRLWRGRLGISEDDALRERRHQVLLDAVPLTVLVVGILGITYGWWKRRST